MKNKREREKQKEELLMLLLAGAIVGGIAYLISDLGKNVSREMDLQSELKQCESDENYERCAIIKRMLDNLKLK